MIDQTNAAPGAIPWYKSNVLRAVAMVVVARILQRFHLGGDAAEYVDTGFDLIELAAAGYAAYSRTKHPLPSITLTKAKADAANTIITGVSPNANVQSPPTVAPPSGP